MKVLFIDQPLGNRGDESAHKALLRKLSSDYPNHNFEVLFIGKAQSSIDAFNINCKNVIYTNIEERRGYLKSLKFILTFPFAFIAEILPTTAELAKKIRSCDAVICSPGGMNMGGFHSWNHLAILKLCQIYKKEIAYYGRSIGPFESNRLSYRIFNRISFDLLRYFSYISLRDLQSFQIAKKLKIQCTLTTDSAFLETPSCEIPNQIAKQIGNVPYVVFVPNELIWHPKFKDIPKSIIDNFWLRVLDVVKDRYPNHKIVMLPQLFNSPNNDYLYFDNVFGQLINVIVLTDNYSSDIQQCIIRKSDLVIGARYHSIVFALNNNVKFISLCYEHKMEGLLDIVGCKENMIDIKNIFLEESSILKTIETLKDKLNNVNNCTEASTRAKQMAKDGYTNFMSSKML